MKKWLLLIIVVMAFMPIKGFSAQILFGETAGYFFQDGDGQNQKLSNAPNAEAARDEFFTNLTGVPTTEEFDGIGGLSYSSDIGTINGVGMITDKLDNGLGPYSDDFYLFSQIDPNDPGTQSDTGEFIRSGGFSIDFGQDIAAFGFFGSDFGDFDGHVEAITYDRETDSGDYAEENKVGSYPISQWNLSGSNGALLYWGIIEDAPFDLIEFTITQITTPDTTIDILGFDNFTIATETDFTPPP